uniref:hypothetical protein n=1 Tax=Segatella hominis TaxID=2518605 RepID=UPI004027B502
FSVVVMFVVCLGCSFLSLLSSVGSFSLSLSLEFSWFLLPLLSSVADLFFKLNFRFSDINISNISFNFDINLKK